MGVTNNIGMGMGGGVPKGCGNQQSQQTWKEMEQQRQNDVLQKEKQKATNLRQESRAEERKRINLERRKRDFITYMQDRHQQKKVEPARKKQKVEAPAETDQVNWNSHTPFSLSHTQRRQALHRNYGNGGYQASSSSSFSFPRQNPQVLQRKFVLLQK